MSRIGFVAITLSLVMWLSISQWQGAHEQRSAADTTLQAIATQRNILNLAVSVSTERTMMYQLLTQPAATRDGNLKPFLETGDRSDVLFTSAFQGSILSMPITESVSATDSLALTQAYFSPNTSPSLSVSGGATATTSHGTSHNTGHSPSHEAHQQAGMPVQAVHAMETDGGSAATYHQMISQLRRSVITEVGETKSEDASALAMHLFHEYSKVLEAVDRWRRAEQATSVINRQEIFTHAQLSNAAWSLIESSDQIAALLIGKKAVDSNEAVSDNFAHQAHMLRELSMVVDLHWGEMVRLNETSDHNDAARKIDAMVAWYPDNYHTVAMDAQRMSAYGYIPVTKLDAWIEAASSVAERVADIRQADIQNAIAVVENVHLRATAVLVLNTVLVAIVFVMAISSLFFFRKVQQQAYRDELTGLHNRRSFKAKLSSGMQQSIGAGASLGLLAIDLDRFKYVNDTMANENGDQLLQHIAARLLEVVDHGETIARLGADEFCVIHQSEDQDSVLALAAKIRQCLSTPFHLNGTTLNIGCSVGVARFPSDAGTLDSLIKAADIALYRAKKTGTNQIITFDREMEKALLHIARTEQDLKVALEQSQFQLYYQPQYNLGSCRVESVEALLRWIHPKRGMIPPDRFIPIAEQSGLMPAIGNWVINEAIRQAASWRDHSDTPLRVAVNVSSEQFLCSSFADTVLSCLDRHQLPGEFLEIELTESVAMCDMQMVVDTLQTLRNAGIKIALDDFGTGYSSLSYLQDLPLDTLKIDKSFVQKLLTGDDRLESITESIVSLGKSLNLETVAEGVETCNQLNHVFDMGISVVQGYFYSRPVPADELAQVIVDIGKIDPPGETISEAA